MPARLILNADDFGLTHGINRAIVELHLAGVLTSATLMATGPAFDDAAALARTLPTLGVGCHITLVDGVPASPSGEISTLLSPNRRTFRPTLAAFVRDLLLHRIDPADITREAHAQIQKLQQAGINPTHIDTHKHTHLFPAVAAPLIEAAHRCNIFALRYPFEPPWSTAATPHTSLTRRTQISLLRLYEPAFRPTTLHTTQGTLGIAATGTLTTKTLTRILQALPAEGTFELCCHPGYNDPALAAQNTRLRQSRDLERQALLTVIPEILAAPQPPELIHYGNL